MIFGMLLVLMMLFRREGLIPEKRTRLLMAARTELESSAPTSRPSRSSTMRQAPHVATGRWTPT